MRKKRNYLSLFFQETRNFSLESILEDGKDVLITDGLLLADLPPLELVRDLLKVGVVAPIPTEGGCNPEALEELLALLDGLLRHVHSAMDAEDALSEPLELLSTEVFDVSEKAGHDDGEGHAMIETVEDCELVANVVSRPTLSDPTPDKVVEGHCGAPEVFSTGLVVGVLTLEGAGGAVDDGTHDGLALLVLDHAHPVVAEVLLAHMHEGISEPVGDLLLGEGVGGLGVEDAEHGVLVVEPALEVLGTPRDHGAHVHLRACRGESHHRPEGAEDVRLVLGVHLGRPELEEVVGVLGVLPVGSRGDVLGGIEHRAAANSEEEVGILLLDKSDGFHAGLVVGVGLDPAELSDTAVLDLGHHLVVDAIALDGAPAVDDHDVFIILGELTELLDGALAEDDLGGVAESEVFHDSKRGALQ